MFYNSDLEFNSLSAIVDTIIEGDPIEIMIGRDTNIDSQDYPFVLDVNDSGFLYPTEKQRDNDFVELIKKLGRPVVIEGRFED